jgi:hypothetical protein
VSSTLTTQVVTEGREALSRATRQALQALVPTLLVVAGGSTVGIDVGAVAALAAITALVSVLTSGVGFKLGATAPVWAQVAERALKAAAGTALGLVTVDGLIPATEVDWQATLTASVGAALVALVMFYTNPPSITGQVVGPVVDEPGPGPVPPATTLLRDGEDRYPGQP